MLRVLVYLLICMMLCSPTIYSQSIELNKFTEKVKRSKDLKTFFINKSSGDYLHSDFLYPAKKILLDKFTLDDFCKDSIIFVEMYGREASGYACSVFKTGDEVIHYYVKRNSPISVEFLNNNSGDHIIEKVRKSQIQKILEKGTASLIHPESYIYITIAILKGDEYEIKSYRTNFFIF